MKVNFLAIFLLGFFLYACKTAINGDVLPNKLPETHTVVDTIIRSGIDRYPTKVSIQWWGNDEDGYVAGYEYTFDNPDLPSAIWKYTTTTDSIFSLTVPAGDDTADFVFHVRAIDNEGAKDPTPAKCTYPVRNTPPTIDFVYNPDNGNLLAGGNPSVTFPIIRYRWLADDADGLDNISGFSLVFNDTNATPVTLPAGVSSIIVKAKNPANNLSDCDIFQGNNSQPLGVTLPGLLLNDTNVLYVRAQDLSNAKSKWMPAEVVYVKKLEHPVLLVNAYTNASNTMDFYLQQMAALGIRNFDTINLFQQESGRYTRLSADNRTQSLLFSLFDHIIWFGNDFEMNATYVSNTMNNFLNQGGNLFFSAYAGNAAAVTSEFYGFAGVDSLIAPAANFRFVITDTSTFEPYRITWPRLGYEAFQPAVRLLKPASGTVSLYNGNIILQQINPIQFTMYNGFRDIVTLRVNPANNSKVVVSSLELSRMNKLGNVTQFFDRVLKGEFGIQ